MNGADKPASLSLDGPDKVRQIRKVLRHAGYTESSVLSLLELPELPTHVPRRQELSLVLRRTRGKGGLGAFVSLFLLQQSIALDDMRRIIAPTPLEDWVDCGLIRVTGRDATASVELWPCGSLIMASDWPDDAPSDPHQVMGIAASSRTLAQAAIQRHSETTLDLGTGCGVLSLLAAANSDAVVAVDSNPRALRMTQFNAELNRVAKIECLKGNLFEPVHGRQFDLIVCNPPFIVAPEQIYLHSHSGQPLDRLCETIARTAPIFMREDGYCQLLCNWVQLAGEDWRSRLQSWFDGSGCDAWVLHSHSEKAAEYAFNRVSNLPARSDEMANRFSAWMEYYERERIEAVGFGLITMRRSNRSSHWFRCESWPEMLGPCGDAIERGFVARDFLADHADEALLKTRLRRSLNLQWRQEYNLSDLASAVVSRLRFTSGLAYTANMDSSIVKFVSRCAGERPLSEDLRETAAMSGEEPVQFAPRFLKIVRRLIELGFLRPVEPGTKPPAN